jgi:hypothetical protein
MCNFTCLLVALYISASALLAADPNSQQLNNSEKQPAFERSPRGSKLVLR